ncbi:hypothetical protein [Streptosporangium sp. NPDC023615]|uniref:hypothetical protein n=1 Tax=Streptosporangium sp. NPDC023615 TaxID=3154794 RepID=UPI003432EEB6
MDVTFKRTGERRYGVVVSLPGQAPLWMDPAPGYDDHIPHDMIHYIVEAELGLTSGVFGRAARGGGGGFVLGGDDDRDHRERRRQRRRLLRREDRFRQDDQRGQGDMALSERLTGLCHVAWKRHHGPPAERPAWLRPQTTTPEDEAAVKRVLARLDRLAPLWNRLPVGGSLTFAWPATEPAPVVTERTTRT